MSSLTRDQFLKLMAAGGATFLGLPSTPAAPPRGLPLPWARLKFIAHGGNDDNWNVHPNGDLNLIDSIREGASVNLEKRWNVGDISNLESMCAFPFLFMHAELSPALTTEHRSNLREYLLRGGFLFAEDCVLGKHNKKPGMPRDMFFQGMAEELQSLVPGAKFEKLPFDHPVFHSCYHFRDGMPHMQGVPHGLHGLTLHGRVLALLSPSDTHCAWTGPWFGEEKSRQALQMGTNIYTFALTQKA
jgi:hypothetical protein